MKRIHRRYNATAILAAGIPLLSVGAVTVATPRPALAAARDGGVEAATRSQVVPIDLPNHAYRSTSKPDIAKFEDALTKVAELNKGRIGTVEVIAWQGGNGPMKALPGLLKGIGYNYAPQPAVPIDGAKLTMFGSVPKGEGAKGSDVLGLWVEQKDVVLLAWTRFTPDKDAARGDKEEAETPADSGSTGIGGLLSKVTDDAGDREPDAEAEPAKPAPRAADASPAGAITVPVDPSTQNVNVMKNAMPHIPTFPKLAPKAGVVRGYVYDTHGKPLAGAKIGARSTSAGGFYSGAQGKTDAKGYYEIAVPWGVAHFYCAGYSVDWGEGRAAMGLHPADGEADQFATTSGAVENFVLLPYGIANRDDVQENPRYAGNYYGGAIVLGWSVNDGGALSQPYELPRNAVIEVTLTPEGPLVDGSKGKTIVLRKSVGTLSFGQLYVTNIPVGAYKISARLAGGGALKMKETGPYSSQPFGLSPKEAQGEATLLFRPGSAKAEMTTAAHGNWDAISITLTRE